MIDLPLHIRRALKGIHWQIMTLASEGQKKHAEHLIDCYMCVLDLQDAVDEAERYYANDMLPRHTRDWHWLGLEVPQECRRYIATREGQYPGEDGFRRGQWGSGPKA